MNDIVTCECCEKTLVFKKPEEEGYSLCGKCAENCKLMLQVLYDEKKKGNEKIHIDDLFHKMNERQSESND